MQFGVEVHEDLNLLTALIERITHSGILASRVLCIRHLDVRCFLHLLCTANQRLDVTTCYCDRQQTYRGQYRETTTYIIGDNKGLVSFFGREAAERTLGFVGNSNDTFLCFLFAYLLLQHGLQQTESQRGLCRRSRFGDIDDTELLVSKELHQFCQVVLADIIAGINDVRILAVFGYKRIEGRSQRLIHGTRAEVRTADTGYDNYLAAFTQLICASLYFCQELIRDRGGQVYPADIVVSCALTILQ